MLVQPTDPIAKAVAYVEANLRRPITLADVAGHVGYSPYHFHRLFLAVTGETLGAHLRKRRLAEAARILAEGQDRVLDIALECQYQSQSALTRSFKRATGLTPGQYRRDRRTAFPLSGPGQARASDQTLGGVVMEPRFVEKGKMLVVGMIYYGENKKGEIGQLWERFTPKSAAIRNAADHGLTYGVCFNDDRSVDPNFCYLACMEVTDLDGIPVDMVGKTLPANTYAVFTHHGSLGGGSEKLAATYRHIYGTWLPNSGYELAASYDFEAYDEDFDPERESSKMDIYIPVKRRA